MAYDQILPSATRTAGANQAGGNISVSSSQNARAYLDVTASTAPTTLDVRVEGSEDGGNSFFTLGSFAQVGAVGTARQSIQIPGPIPGVLRAVYTLVGTNYTFAVTLRR